MHAPAGQRRSSRSAMDRHADDVWRINGVRRRPDAVVVRCHVTCPYITSYCRPTSRDVTSAGSEPTSVNDAIDVTGLQREYRGIAMSPAKLTAAAGCFQVSSKRASSVGRDFILMSSFCSERLHVRLRNVILAYCVSVMMSLGRQTIWATDV